MLAVKIYFSYALSVSLTVMNGIFRKLSKGLNVLANIGKFVTLSIVILCGLYNLCKGTTFIRWTDL